MVTPEKNNTLPRLRHGRETNIKKDVEEIEWEDVERCHVT